MNTRVRHRRVENYDNNLTGPIPAELGNLVWIEVLELSRNALTGPIPPTLGDRTGLGRLTGLVTLRLNDNRLTGPVPADLGGVTYLNELLLADNPGLTGPIPLNVTNLRSLRLLDITGTGLCVPQTTEFRWWLDAMSFNGALCGQSEPWFSAPAPRAGMAARLEDLADLRTAVAVLRERCGLGPLRWTDQVIVRGLTPVRAVHLTELRAAIGDAFGACGRTPPTFTSPAPARGTPIRAVHFAELRAAVLRGLQ